MLCVSPPNRIMNNARTMIMIPIPMIVQSPGASAPRIVIYYFRVQFIDSVKMRRRKAASISAIVVMIIVLAVNYLVPQPTIVTHAVATRIVDGDTIVVEGGERVRLLDIDTPENGEPCSANATARLKGLIDGKEVALVSGVEDKDVYGRLLRYVFLNDTLINVQMVREGWANLYIVNKDPRYYDYFIQAEQAAKKENLCVWSL